MKSLVITDAEQTSKTHARVCFRFPVLHEYVNHTKGLHGGSLGIIFDIVGAWPMFLVARPDFWAYAGVTRSLRYVLLNPVQEGETLVAEGEVSHKKTLACVCFLGTDWGLQTVHVGKRLALVKAVLKRERDGAIVATCEHERYLTIPPQMKPQPKM